MIKKYNQFVSERINEEFDQEFDEIDTNQQESDLAARDLEEEMAGMEDENRFNDFEEEEQPEEEGDIYQNRLQELADALGVEVEDGKVMYNGKKIIFPSETEMFHVDGKKFKTAEEVVNYLEGSVEERPDMERVPSDLVEDPEMELELQESKSYKNTRKFNKRR